MHTIVFSWIIISILRYTVIYDKLYKKKLLSTNNKMNNLMLTGLLVMYLGSFTTGFIIIDLIFTINYKFRQNMTKGDFYVTFMSSFTYVYNCQGCYFASGNVLEIF